jgi:cob(I)alamin adenosyltransferase
MRIYTKTGDDGTTGLYGGARVSKADARVEAYGGVDECNAAIGLARAGALPAAIDALEATLPKLTTFVLPGGSDAAARLHVARTACRRAERGVVRLSETETVDPVAVRYLNRLSDLLFVQARAANAAANVPDVPWTPAKS